MSQRSTVQHCHTDTPFCTMHNSHITGKFAVPVPHSEEIGRCILLFLCTLATRLNHSTADHVSNLGKGKIVGENFCSHCCQRRAVEACPDQGVEPRSTDHYCCQEVSLEDRYKDEKHKRPVITNKRNIAMGPVRIRHHSHHFATQSSHVVDRAGWQAKMASIEFWIQ